MRDVGFGMVDGPVAERGVLTAPHGLWDAAVRQAEVIRPLAEKDTVGLADADEAAAMLQISRRQVYVLVGRWRAGEGVVSDGASTLIVDTACYQRRCVSAVICGARGLGEAMRSW
ncbi:helix-turn-helix domain-containing protein [Streptomyces fungicidicus]